MPCGLGAVGVRASRASGSWLGVALGGTAVAVGALLLLIVAYAAVGFGLVFLLYLIGR